MFILRFFNALACLLLIPLICSGNAFALTVTVDSGFRSQWLGPGMDYMEDESTGLTAQAVRQRDHWQTFDGHEVNFGFSDSVFWLRFSVDNRSGVDQQLLLDNQFPMIDSLVIYIQRSDGYQQQQRLGDAQPAYMRQMLHSHLLLPLSLPADTRADILIRVQSETGLQLPIVVWEQDAFLQQDHPFSIMQGVLYGLLIALVIYHLIIFLSVRELAFLHYSLFNLFLLGTFCGLQGVAAAYIWTESVTINDTLVLVSMAGAQTFSTMFMNGILGIPSARPRLGKLMYGIAGIACVLMLASLLAPHRWMAKPVLLLIVVSISVLTYAQIRRVLDGYPIAKYILAGGAFGAFGFAVTTLANTGVIAGTPVTQGAAYVGIVLLSLMDAFALSYRMNMDRQLRLQAQGELLETQRQLNADLDRRVQERTNELQAANERLMELSTTDGLTGLKNRRHFNELFAHEFKRACREQKPLSLLLLDIDHFKQLNDQYGHPFGDLCLTQAAQLIANTIRRPPDSAARYGGEEFAVLLPNTDKEGALHVADKIRESIGQHQVSDGQQQAVMTVSIGVASFIPSQNNTTEALLKAADDLLYRAKHNGRNRVEG